MLNLLPQSRAALTNESKNNVLCDLDGEPTSAPVFTFLDGISGKRFALVSTSAPKARTKQSKTFLSAGYIYFPGAESNGAHGHAKAPSGHYAPAPDFTKHGIDGKPSKASRVAAEPATHEAAGEESTDAAPAPARRSAKKK